MKSNYLLRMSTDLKKQLQEQSKRKGITLSSLITNILWEYVEKQKGVDGFNDSKNYTF